MKLKALGMTVVSTLLAYVLASPVSLGAFAAQAQDSSLGGVASTRQILQLGLYPPDIIMKHQQALGITDQQRETIYAAVKVFQAEVGQLQWTLQNKQQIFKQALGKHRIESEQALSQARQILAMESEFKLAHFKLLFAIKNALTQTQIEMIEKQLRERRVRAVKK